MDAAVCGLLYVLGWVCGGRVVRLVSRCNMSTGLFSLHGSCGCLLVMWCDGACTCQQGTGLLMLLLVVVVGGEADAVCVASGRNESGADGRFVELDTQRFCCCAGV